MLAAGSQCSDPAAYFHSLTILCSGMYIAVHATLSQEMPSCAQQHMPCCVESGPSQHSMVACRMTAYTCSSWVSAGSKRYAASWMHPDPTRPASNVVDIWHFNNKQATRVARSSRPGSSSMALGCPGNCHDVIVLAKSAAPYPLPLLRGCRCTQPGPGNDDHSSCVRLHQFSQPPEQGT